MQLDTKLSRFQCTTLTSWEEPGDEVKSVGGHNHKVVTHNFEPDQYFHWCKVLGFPLLSLPPPHPLQPLFSHPFPSCIPFLCLMSFSPSSHNTDTKVWLLWWKGNFFVPGLCCPYSRMGGAWPCSKRIWSTGDSMAQKEQKGYGRMLVVYTIILRWHNHNLHSQDAT